MKKNTANKKLGIEIIERRNAEAVVKAERQRFFDVLEMGIDITESKRTEEELKKHWERLEALAREYASKLEVANEVLGENERLMNRAQEIAHLGSWELDVVNNRLSWSDEIYRIFGLRPQEFKATYEAFLERVHPEDRKAVDAAYSSSLREGRDTYEIEHRVIRKSTGEIRYVHEKCEHIRDEAGRIIRSVGMVQDITERKCAEEKINHLASFPQLNPNPIIELSAAGKVVFSNLAALKTLEQLGVAKKLKLFLPEDFVQILKNLNSGKKKDFIREVKIKDAFFIETLTTIPELKVVRIYTRDITERKKIEEAHKEAEERYHTLFTQSPDGILIIDPVTMKTLEFNDKACEQLGYTRKEFQELRITDYEAKETAAETKAHVKKLLKEGEGIFETKHKTKNGGLRDVLVQAKKIKLMGKDLFLCAFHDITVMKNTERALEEARSSLEIKVAERTEELVQTNRQLIKEILERKGIERAIRVRSAVLKIMGKAPSRKEYLGILVRYIKGLSDCRYCGIRVLNEEGEIPYESYLGFSREFWERENWLSVNRDQCACIRVVTGNALLQDKPCMSKGGSFVSNDALGFVNSLSREEKICFRGVCMQSGFHSVAVIPISYRNEVIAAIHIADEAKDMVSRPKIEFLELLTPLIGEGIHKFDIEDKIRQSHIAQSIISALLRYSFTEKNLEKIFLRCLELLFSMNWLSTEPKGGIYLVGDEPETLVLKAQKNLPEFIKRECANIPHGKCCCGKAAKDKKIYFASTVDNGHEITYEGMAPHGHYCVPILYGDKLLGVINLFLPEKYRRDLRKEEFLAAVSNALAGIIQRRQAEEKLRQTEKELERSKRLSDIGMLAATVAHELRNPLAAIRMASFNIKRKAQNPLLDKHLFNIEKKISESDQIINNLLFYSRLKEPHYETVDLHKIMEECLELAKKHVVNNEIKVTKKYRVLHRLLVDADPLQMKELFGNILNNAYDAMHGSQGSIEIGATNDKNEAVNIYFKDTGVGMDEEHLKQAHEPFFTTKAKGTGLGLTVCFQIAHLHNGRIELASQKGKGTTVTVTLPIKRNNG